MDAAFDLLTEHEYDAVQMRDVAERAGVALGTVYRYFGSKEHLFAAALVRWGEALGRRRPAAPAEAAADLSARVAEVYLRAIQAFARRPQVYRALVVIESSGDPAARAAYAEFTRVSQARFAEPLADLEPDRAAAITTTLLSVLNGVLRPWARGELSIDEARRRMTDAIDLIFSPPPRPRRRVPSGRELP